MSDDTETDLDEAEEIRDAETAARIRAENRIERAERAERMAREGAQAMAEHHAAAKALDERTVRLRSMRLAKEAADAQAEASAKEAKAAAKGAMKGAAKSGAKASSAKAGGAKQAQRKAAPDTSTAEG